MTDSYTATVIASNTYTEVTKHCIITQLDGDFGDNCFPSMHIEKLVYDMPEHPRAQRVIDSQLSVCPI